MTLRLRVATTDGLYEDDDLTLVGHEVTGLSGEWALVDATSLWRRDQSGWTEVARLPDGRRGQCILARPEGALVGTDEAHLVRLRAEDFEIVDEFDRMPGRAAWYTPWGRPADVRSLAGEGDRVFANVHVGGIAASSDGGSSWTPTPLDIDTDVHQVIVAGDWVVAAAGAGGLAHSSDGGATWSMETEGLHATYCRAVALAGTTVLLTASTGPGTRRAAVYRRAVDDDRFERCEVGLPEWFADNIDTGCLVASGDAAAFGTADGSVYVSGDAGATWELTRSGLPQVTALAFV